MSVGVHDRRKEIERRLVKVLQVIRVSKRKNSIQTNRLNFISKHPSFDNRYLLNDIAILKLEDYLQPSTIIQFACLPYNFSDVNTTGIVIGFGDTIPGANRGNIEQTSISSMNYIHNRFINPPTSEFNNISE